MKRNPKDDLMELAVREGAKHVVKWFKEAKAVVAEAQQEVKVEQAPTKAACKCSHHDATSNVPLVAETLRKWLFQLVTDQEFPPFKPTVVSHVKQVGNNSETDLQLIRLKVDDQDVFVYVSNYEL